jgi:hypothetical protein
VLFESELDELESEELDDSDELEPEELSLLTDPLPPPFRLP